MTTFLRHVSTIYANLTALYSIGQSVQVIKVLKCFAQIFREILSGSRALGDGGLLLSLRAHDRQTQREVRGQHARQRGGGAGVDAPPDPLPRPELRLGLLREVAAGQHQDTRHAQHEP